jgi:proteasome lid subunit RPN8/RPN11
MTATWSLGPPRERAPASIPIIASAATPTRQVRLSRAQRRRMIVEAQASPDREVGGGLYGYPAATWDKTLTIAAAHPPSESCLRYRNSFLIDIDGLEAAEHDDFRCIGIWHSHPSGGAGLSPTDLAVFAHMRAEWDATRGYLPQFVAVIVTPDKRDGWIKPQLHGWRLWHANEGAWNECVTYEPVDLALWGDEPDPCPRPTVEVWDDATRRRYLLAAGITPATPPPAPRWALGADERDRQPHVSARRPRRPTTQHRQTSSWMVATRTFTATYAGDAVVISKGERVTPDHELVARYPDAFTRLA